MWVEEIILNFMHNGRTYAPQGAQPSGVHMQTSDGDAHCSSSAGLHPSDGDGLDAMGGHA